MSLSNLSSSNSNGAFLDYGEFRSGVYIQTSNQILYFTDENGNKVGYQWKGLLPHTTTTNDPNTDGGISDTAWCSIVGSGFIEKLSKEGIDLSWKAHLPTVEVSYNLPHKTLKIWEKGLNSTVNDYWLYTDDGTVWNGVGVLGDIPDVPFKQIVPQNNVIEWSSIATEGQNQFTVPYEFTNISVFINGLLQNKSTGGYVVNGSTVTLNGSLKAGDDIHVVISNVPVMNLDYALKNDLFDYILKSDLIDSSGSSLVGLNQGGTLQDAINYVTPEMFGAIGDGITDDTTAIQNAVNYASLNKKTCLLIYGNKSYILSNTINLICNIVGDGLPKFIQKTDSKSCFDITADNISVYGINVTPASVVSSALQFAGIVIKNANNCIIEKCNVLYAGRTDREGSGIGIYNGSNNIISNCKASGANLSPGTRHDYGGNDFFVYGNSSRNKLYKNIGIGANIRGILQQTTILGQKCNYNEYDSNVSIGHIGYGHLCYELNHDSSTEMIGTTFRNGFVANITGSATDPSSGLKYFGAGVYNQEGQDTRIENYYIYNVCQDENIQQTLPMAGISSTRGDIRIQNNFISLSKKCGIKISTSSIGGDERTAIITNNTIKNSSDEAVYLVNTNRSIINGLNVVNSGRIIRATANTSYTTSNIIIDNVSAKSSSGILLDGFSSAIVNNCNGDSCTSFFSVQNISYLLASKIISNSDTAIGISISSSVTDGFLRDSISSNGVTGFNLAGKIVYERLIAKNNTTNFTGLYSGITTLSSTATIDVSNLNFVAIGAGTDISTIIGGITNQIITVRATASRTIIHNTSSIILKSSANVTLSANNTIQLWCIDGTRWLEI